MNPNTCEDKMGELQRSGAAEGSELKEQGQVAKSSEEAAPKKNLLIEKSA